MAELLHWIVLSCIGVPNQVASVCVSVYTQTYTKQVKAGRMMNSYALEKRLHQMSFECSAICVTS